jgi:antitoxin VapB
MGEIRLYAFLGSSSYPDMMPIMRREGERLIIEPAPPRSLLAVLDKLSPIQEKFPSIVELASEPVDL